MGFKIDKMKFVVFLLFITTISGKYDPMIEFSQHLSYSNVIELWQISDFACNTSWNLIEKSFKITTWSLFFFIRKSHIVMCEVSQKLRRSERREIRKFLRRDTHASFPGWLNFFFSSQCASATSTVLHCSDNQCDRDKRSDEFEATIT